MRGRDRIKASHPCKNFWTSFYVKRQWTSIIPNADSSMTPLATLSWAGFRGGQGGLVLILFFLSLSMRKQRLLWRSKAGSFIDMVAWKNWKSCCCSCPCCWKNHEKSVVAVWRAGYGSATTGSKFFFGVQNGRNYRSWVVIHFAVVVVVIVDTHISHYSHSFLLSAWGRILHQVEARKAKQERLTSLTTCTLTMTAQPLKQTLMLL